MLRKLWDVADREDVRLFESRENFRQPLHSDELMNRIRQSSISSALPIRFAVTPFP